VQVTAPLPEFVDITDEKEIDPVELPGGQGLRSRGGTRVAPGP
jgi:hypothetical protein